MSMLLFSVWLDYFSRYILTSYTQQACQDFRNYVRNQETKIWYQGLSKRRLCKEYVGRKVDNAPGDNSYRSFAFLRTPSLSAKEKLLT